MSNKISNKREGIMVLTSYSKNVYASQLLSQIQSPTEERIDDVIGFTKEKIQNRIAFTLPPYLRGFSVNQIDYIATEAKRQLAETAIAT